MLHLPPSTDSFQLFMGNYPSYCPHVPEHYGWGGTDNISQPDLIENIVTVKSHQNILKWAGAWEVQGSQLAKHDSYPYRT